jgi:hypothetical protein
MKKYLSLLFVILLLTGCSRSPAQKDILAKVNNYEITRSEFEDEFKVSSYGKIDTPESRRDFLNTLIDRKLILQYAQQKDYDKEKGFLKLIEKFWEQSLLKVALDKKAREIESKISSSGWETKRTEETKMMSDWMNELRKNAHITIKDGTLSNAADKNRGR